jgi:primosomal protein N''
VASKKPKETSTLLERSQRAVDKALATLEECIERTSKKLLEAEEYDSTLASHINWLARQLVSTMEAARKMEASQGAKAKKLTPKQQDDLIRVYVSELPRERLAELIKFIGELHPTGSVL